MGNRQIRALDLFAGCGGLSMGLSLAGIETVVATDHWKVACDTFKANHKSTKVLCCEAADFLNRVKDEIDLNALTELFPDKDFLIPEVTGNHPPEDFIKQCENLDLIIIPGLSFDKRGYRLGRGGGYYDKLLSKIIPKIQSQEKTLGDENTGSKTTHQPPNGITQRSQALTLGIIPKELHLENLPNEPHDIKVDLVLAI